MDRSMIDVVSGGTLVDKTPKVTRNLIANMVANSQQFNTGIDHALKWVNEVHATIVATAFGTQRLEQRMDELASLVRQLTASQHQVVAAPVKTCGICSLSTYSTDECPIRPEEEVLP